MKSINDLGRVFLAKILGKGFMVVLNVLLTTLLIAIAANFIGLQLLSVFVMGLEQCQ